MLQKIGQTQADTEIITDQFFEAVRHALEVDGIFNYSKEMTVEVKEKPATRKVNPQTGKEIMTEDGYKYKVKLLKYFQDYINS